MPIKHEWNGTILTITSDSGTSSADLQGAKGATGARGARGLTGRTGGGALIEDGVIRDDTTWSSAGIMDRFAEQIGTEGNPLVIKEPLPNFPYSITATIDAKQEGTIESYPAGYGKNMFDYKTPKEARANTTYSISGEQLTIKTTSASTWQGVIYDNFLAKAGTTYSGSIYVHENTGGYVNLCVRKKADGSIQDGTGTDSGIAGTGKKTFSYTPTEDIEVYICILITSGTITENEVVVSQAQVEVGSTANAYEPYENIRPIKCYDAINITRSGKNLLPYPYPGKSTTINGISYTINTDGTITAKGTAINTDGYTNFSVYPGYSTQPNTMFYLPAGRYKLVCKGSKNTNLLYAVIYERVGTNSYKSIVSTRNNEYIGFKTTEPSDKYYLMVACRSTYSPDETLQIMIVPYEETDLTYEPYKGNTYTISLGNKYCQGVLDVNRGELVIDWECLTYDGTENWGTISSGDNLYFCLDIGEYGYIIQGKNNEKCSHYKYGNVSSSNTTINTYYHYNSTGANVCRFAVRPDVSVITDKQLWKQYLVKQYEAGTPLQSAYVLAQPKVIKLTPEEIKAISGNNTLYSNADNLMVFGRMDTMKQLSNLQQAVLRLNERIIELEAKVGE